MTRKAGFGLRRTTAWSAVLIATAALAAGCGSSDDGSASTAAGTGTGSGTAAQPTGGASAAAKTVADASKPITAWDGFDEPIRPPAGKRIVAIECSSLGVGCVQGAKAAEEAAQAIGWKADVVNGKGDPTVWNSAIQAAVAAKADGIVLFAISPALVKDAVAKAKAAGVPVVAAYVGPKADSLVVSDAQQGGKIMAAYLADASGGKANALVLNDAEFVLTDERNKAMVSELQTICPDCKTKDVEFTFATMPTKLPGQVAAALQADPTIDYVVVPFDAAVQFVRQGIQQAGSKAKVASFEGDPSTMKTIGDGTQAADLAVPNTWAGWQSVDDLVRLMQGEPVKNAPLPVRLFTDANKADAANWDGDLDFRAKYRELWGQG